MLRILLVFAVANLAFPALAQERLSPTEFVFELTREFNAGELDAYVQRFAYPHSRVIGSNFVVVSEPDGARRAHELALESGWAYSKINEIETVKDQGDFALLRANFSRVGGDGAVMVTFDAFYTMGFREGVWKVLHLAASGLPQPAPGSASNE